MEMSLYEFLKSRIFLHSKFTKRYEKNIFDNNKTIEKNRENILRRQLIGSIMNYNLEKLNNEKINNNTINYENIEELGIIGKTINNIVLERERLLNDAENIKIYSSNEEQQRLFTTNIFILLNNYENGIFRIVKNNDKKSYIIGILKPWIEEYHSNLDINIIFDKWLPDGIVNVNAYRDIGSRDKILYESFAKGALITKLYLTDNNLLNDKKKLLNRLIEIFGIDKITIYNNNNNNNNNKLLPTRYLTINEDPIIYDDMKKFDRKKNIFIHKIKYNNILNFINKNVNSCKEPIYLFYKKRGVINKNIILPYNLHFFEDDNYLFIYHKNFKNNYNKKDIECKLNNFIFLFKEGEDNNDKLSTFTIQSTFLPIKLTNYRPYTEIHKIIIDNNNIKFKIIESNKNEYLIYKDDKKFNFFIKNNESFIILLNEENNGEKDIINNIENNFHMDSTLFYSNLLKYLQLYFKSLDVCEYNNMIKLTYKNTINENFITYLYPKII